MVPSAPVFAAGYCSHKPFMEGCACAGNLIMRSAGTCRGGRADSINYLHYSKWTGTISLPIEK